MSEKVFVPQKLCGHASHTLIAFLIYLYYETK